NLKRSSAVNWFKRRSFSLSSKMSIRFLFMGMEPDRLIIKSTSSRFTVNFLNRNELEKINLYAAIFSSLFTLSNRLDKLIYMGSFRLANLINNMTNALFAIEVPFLQYSKLVRLKESSILLI